MERFTQAIDRFTEAWGFWVSLLILPMIAVVIYEIIMRKFLSMPTSWGFDVTVYIYGAHFMLGMNYVELHDSHVRVDAISRLLPDRGQLWLRLITIVILFLPYVGALAYAGVEFALDSWLQWEHGQSSWRPPIYPVKTIIPVAFIMLLLQGISSFYRDFKKLRGN